MEMIKQLERMPNVTVGNKVYKMRTMLWHDTAAGPHFIEMSCTVIGRNGEKLVCWCEGFIAEPMISKLHTAVERHLQECEGKRVPTLRKELEGIFKLHTILL